MAKLRRKRMYLEDGVTPVNVITDAEATLYTYNPSDTNKITNPTSGLDYGLDSFLNGLDSRFVDKNNTYAGGTAVTLNGTDKSSATASLYAPTTSGTAGQVLVSDGNTPTWRTGEVIRVITTGNTGTAAVTTSPYTYAKWNGTSSEITSLYNGLTILYKVPVAGNGTYGTCLLINSLGYHPVVRVNNSMISTRYSVNSLIILCYDTSVSGTIYNNSASSSSITGVWRVINDANENTLALVYVYTGASVAAKVGSSSSYYLLSNSYTIITLVNSNTAASALTLNINSQGAKAIYINGSASSSTNYTLPRGTYLVYYDGTKYYFRTDGLITTSGLVDINNNRIDNKVQSTNNTTNKLYLIGTQNQATSAISNSRSSVYINSDGNLYSNNSKVITTNDLISTNGYDYVEIGGIKWATKNVGANSITDYGLFFQWGDIQGYTAAQCGSSEGKKYFSWADYKYGNGTSSPGAADMTKYNSTDGKTVLDASDDAVTTIWGGNWRMPTTAEFQALGNAVNTAWTTNYQGSGVAGLICTDKTDSSKTLFFPAAGVCNYGSVTNVGIRGYCWSSSLNSSDVQKAYYLNFLDGYVYWQNLNNVRTFGLHVRGVVDESLIINDSSHYTNIIRHITGNVLYINGNIPINDVYVSLNITNIIFTPSILEGHTCRILLHSSNNNSYNISISSTSNLTFSTGSLSTSIGSGFIDIEFIKINGNIYGSIK